MFWGLLAQSKREAVWCLMVVGAEFCCRAHTLDSPHDRRTVVSFLLSKSTATVLVAANKVS